MNKTLLDYIDRKTGDYADRRRNRDNRDNRDRRDMNDYEDNRRVRDNRDYENEYDYGYHRDNRDYRDYGDYEDERDYGKRAKSLMRIRKSDMKHWKHNMQNADGTKGEHYDMEQIMHAAEKLGIKFNSFDEKEFCIAVNMMYSDYCRVIKKYAPPEKELLMCAELAKAFLDDEDGPEPSEKLALYYYCIVDSE